MKTFALLVFVLLSGCATTLDPNYQLYATNVRLQNEAEHERIGAIAQAAKECDDARCVENVAAMAALAQAGGGRGSSTQPYQRTFHPAWGIVAAAAPQLIGAAAQIWTQKYASETARQNSHDQWQTLDNALSRVSTNIEVGGDFVSGTQHIGDTVAVGRDYIGTQHLGDTIGGSQHVGDAIGGNRVDGDGNRFNSDGPWFDSFNGGNCVSGAGGDGGTGAPGGSGAPIGTGDGNNANGGSGANGGNGAPGGACVGGEGG